jgi:DNA-binding NarL/FixJ family response regulator
VTSAEPRQIVEAFELGAKSVVLKASLPSEWGPGIELVIAGQYWIADESISVLLRAARQSLAQPENAQAGTFLLRKFGLTPRETEIARKIADGRSNREVGDEFRIRERTVKHHLTNVFKKVGVSSRLELALLVRDTVASRQPSVSPLLPPRDAKANAV